MFNASNTFFGQRAACRCATLINALRDTYCGTIGAEFMYISDQRRKRWWHAGAPRADPLDAELQRREKRHILERLTAAEGLERYLHTKYVGQKRFSLRRRRELHRRRSTS